MIPLHKMVSRRSSMSFLVWIGIISVFCLCGCTGLAECYFQKTVDAPQGDVILQGLKAQVTVRRDAYGIPVIEAKNKEDLVYAAGYVHASDRLTQMVGMKLLAEGRLAEMAGPSVLNPDIYMRAMNIRGVADHLAKNMRPEHLALLERYAAGVNAYITTHRDRLPPALALAGFTPAAWTVADSLSLFALLNFALSFNLHEEIAALVVAQKVGAGKTAWLLPVYPDEPLPFDEAAKLQGLDLQGKAGNMAALAALQPLLRSLGLGGLAASNNWAIGKEKTRGKASILANDQHLVLSMPAMYSLIHLRCPDFDAAGVSLAGIPAIVAGYNGRIAWGMTMVMADNQDIFLERLKAIDGRLHYLCQDRWLPTVEHREVFAVKDQAPRTVIMHETAHGRLLNDILNKDPVSVIQAKKLELPYGIALSQANIVPGDESVNAFFDLMSASTAADAARLARRIRAIPLNMVFADRDNIAWQVTGSYPVRARGRGLLPQPGWTGAYDWRGFLDAGALPHAENPAAGFIGTANHRTVAPDYPHVLSSSWYWPERAERIEQMARATNQHTSQTSRDMQLDVYSLFVPKLQDLLLKGPQADRINNEITTWKDEVRIQKARTALEMLKQFDGRMTADSPGAALVCVFLDSATKNIFLDELGPAEASVWKAFLVLNNESYNATCDHLLARGDESPFWDNVHTPQKETKAQILARTLADAIVVLEKSLGLRQQDWRWGELHTYLWETDTYKLASGMGFFERAALNALKPYFNRGPYPAPGDHFTLNVSMYMMGENYDTWIIPNMRLIVDFSLKEPMTAVNSSGQSDNPSGPHYDDGISAWREGRYIPFPFQDEAIQKQYQDVLTLKPRD